MNKTIKYITYLWVTLFTLCFCGCSDEEMVKQKEGEGTPLNIYVETKSANTRLAELPVGDINTGKNEGKDDEYKNIGLYIYYEDDYKDGDKGNLTKPYIRNLECKVDNGKLVPANGEGQIYIYDRMTIVAFYPYNAYMSKEENYFKVKADEEAYPISESDYKNQTYIPYRAETTVNPTNAYMIRIGFTPKHTCKVQIVLTSSDKNMHPFPESFNSGSVRILPAIDPVTEGDYEGIDRRENWIDGTSDLPEKEAPVGGKYVRCYTAYIWKSNEKDKHHDDTNDNGITTSGKKHHDNIIHQGDILFQSDKLTLAAPYEVNLAERNAYRYGYDLDSGETFIPTSDNLIYDAISLQNAKFNESRAFQVCDINLNGQTWTPLETYKGTYDGGGHKILNLKIDQTTLSNTGSKPDKQLFGLFSTITDGATLMNVHLVSPTISIDASATTDTCYVGALCGAVNPELSEAKKRELINRTLPKELSETVREALIQEALLNLTTKPCHIRGCKVEDPHILIKNSINPYVGGLCGSVGEQKQIGHVKDSYVCPLQKGKSTPGIIVNKEGDAHATSLYVGSFCGILNNGTINNSYTTLTTVEGYDNTNTNKANGFTQISKTAPTETSISGCYTSYEEATLTTGVSLFINSSATSWPLFGDTTDTDNTCGNKQWPCLSWTNSWKAKATYPQTPRLIWEERVFFPL